MTVPEGTLADAIQCGPVRLLVRRDRQFQLSSASAAPYRWLLTRLFARPRRPSARKNLRQVKAQLARLAGAAGLWDVPDTASEAELRRRLPTPGGWCAEEAELVFRMEKFDRRTDDEMLQLFKGRGGRSKLVRLVPARSLDRGKEELPLWIEGCCEWINYLRQRKIRSVADLEVDLKRVGILGTEPPNLFAPAVKAVEPWLDLPEL